MDINIETFHLIRSPADGSLHINILTNIKEENFFMTQLVLVTEQIQYDRIFWMGGFANIYKHESQMSLSGPFRSDWLTVFVVDDFFVPSAETTSDQRVFLAVLRSTLPGIRKIVLQGGVPCLKIKGKCLTTLTQAVWSVLAGPRIQVASVAAQAPGGFWSGDFLKKGSLKFKRGL